MAAPVANRLKIACRDCFGPAFGAPVDAKAIDHAHAFSDDPLKELV
jgi:hypothetical protein